MKYTTESKEKLMYHSLYDNTVNNILSQEWSDERKISNN